jgi:hypothetical protein
MSLNIFYYSPFVAVIAEHSIILSFSIHLSPLCTNGLNSSATITPSSSSSSHFYEKLISRSATLGLIAEEVLSFDLISKTKIKKFLKETI